MKQKVTEIREIVRANLIKCRKENGLTQTEVGMVIGKEKSTVASWEQGKSMPDIDTLYRLATYYHKTIGFMFGDEDQ